jgi:hypothetical protein
MSSSSLPRLCLGIALLSGCASGLTTLAPPADARVAAPPIAWEGHVAYELRTPTRFGASREITRRPARFVRVQLLDPSGGVLAETSADEAGRFRAVAAGARAVRVLAAVDHDGYRLAVGPDPRGERIQSIERPLERPDEPIEIVASEVDPTGPSGAFHIVDTMLRGATAVRSWVGATLPPAYVLWQRGGTHEWSYYRGQRPAGSGRYFLELLGGEPGQQATSDTDEHDEEIVLHEFGHFVMDVLTTDSSPGGTHPAEHLVDPGLAWEEGRASWFAAAVQGEPLYRDTIGIEPRGQLRVSEDLEVRGPGPRGIGSEEGVSELLWDLTDGVEGYPDRDGDGVALGPAAVLQAMIGLAQEPGAYPCIATFLQHVVDRRVADADAIRRVLAIGGHPASVFPDDATSPWPAELALGTPVRGKIDGVSNPAPSGGPARPGNGYDAVRTFRLRVPRRGFLEVALQIYGTGRPDDHQDLDLELRDARADLLADSTGTTARERLGRLVDPGWYVIYVRDGGVGNQAGFELSVELHE